MQDQSSPSAFRCQVHFDAGFHVTIELRGEESRPVHLLTNVSGVEPSSVARIHHAIGFPAREGVGALIVDGRRGAVIAVRSNVIRLEHLSDLEEGNRHLAQADSHVLTERAAETEFLAHRDLRDSSGHFDLTLCLCVFALQEQGGRARTGLFPVPFSRAQAAEADQRQTDGKDEAISHGAQSSPCAEQTKQEPIGMVFSGR